MVHGLVDGLADPARMSQARAEILALGHDATPILVTRYQDPSFTVRWQMVDIAGELRDLRAVPALVDRILRDEDAHVRWRGMYALAEMEDPGPGTGLLRPALAGPDPETTHRAALALAFLGRADGLALIHAGTRSPDSWVRWESIESLTKVHDETTPDVLAPVLVSGEQREREQAVMTLSVLGTPRARELLVGALADPAPGVRWRAAMVLGLNCHPTVVEALQALIARETDPEVLRNARDTSASCSALLSAP